MTARETNRRRPLTGEPVAVDLLNTRWVVGADHFDLLDSEDGLRQWLTEAGLAERFTADTRTRAHLLAVRDTLARLLRDPTDPEATDQLNAVLGHGSVRRLLRDGAPASTVEFDDPARGPAWLAAADLLDLMERPDRLRGCANPDCVLHFFDTSKNGTRRWCSMSGCGNRAKAARHHARGRAGRTA
ncbi:CGNR zinc finger domain-containing protein [Nocardiopsis metallicus]|uniref:Putative RNA-binding Zn ribbon-like protein n=1 Tax=Nocardiopsis metallicus TaxID=179819 RepID=A0A840WHA2_9ACTN|nr:CGNR zinc finger domain-containing protein [Nocardiopsis metallicus]MBB5489448.1 putative RNA-binding Zn ribbon-like protein [Nocardiopsis metallicus]